MSSDISAPRATEQGTMTVNGYQYTQSPEQLDVAGDFGAKLGAKVNHSFIGRAADDVVAAKHNIGEGVSSFRNAISNLFGHGGGTP